MRLQAEAKKSTKAAQNKILNNMKFQQRKLNGGSDGVLKLYSSFSKLLNLAALQQHIFHYIQRMFLKYPMFDISKQQTQRNSVRIFNLYYALEFSNSSFSRPNRVQTRINLIYSLHQRCFQNSPVPELSLSPTPTFSPSDTPRPSQEIFLKISTWI